VGLHQVVHNVFQIGQDFDPGKCLGLAVGHARKSESLTRKRPAGEADLVARAPSGSVPSSG
jgi:hypothetical protein